MFLSLSLSCLPSGSHYRCSMLVQSLRVPFVRAMCPVPCPRGARIAMVCVCTIAFSQTRGYSCGCFRLALSFEFCLIPMPREDAHDLCMHTLFLRLSELLSHTPVSWSAPVRAADNTGAPIWRERGGSLRVPHHRPSAVDTFRDRRSSLKARRPRYHVTLERFSDSPSHPGSPYVKPSPAHGSAMG